MTNTFKPFDTLLAHLAPSLVAHSISMKRGELHSKILVARGEWPTKIRVLSLLDEKYQVGSVSWQDWNFEENEDGKGE